MDPGEIRDHLRPMAQNLKEKAQDNGSWYAYQNELCVEDDMFIHEYKDGRKELVQLGDETGDFKILKVL